jgi:hypothetical protein
VLIEGLSHKIEKLLTELNESEKINRALSQQGDEKWFSLIGEEASLKKAIEKEEEELKGVKMDNRKTF